jgi:hypothetical protein
MYDARPSVAHRLAACVTNSFQRIIAYEEEGQLTKRPDRLSFGVTALFSPSRAFKVRTRSFTLRYETFIP